MPEPGNFFEAKDAEAAIAKFDSNGRSGGDVPQEMQMLVAVRMRPLWQKEASKILAAGRGLLLADACSSVHAAAHASYPPPKPPACAPPWLAVG